MNNAVRRVSTFLTVGAIALSTVMATGVAAQEEPEGFPLPAFTAYCEPGNAGPFVGCTPWAGVPVSFVALDQEFAETCFTEPGDRAASCTVYVPFGSTIVASIMPAEIPDGYVLRGPTAHELTIPDGPPEGVFGGPTFILDAQVVEEPEPVPTEEPIVEEPIEEPVVEQPIEEPVVDEPAPMGDEPTVDDPVLAVSDTAAPISLPNTGVGGSIERTQFDLAVAGLVVGAATAMAGGALTLRRSSR